MHAILWCLISVMHVSFFMLLASFLEWMETKSHECIDTTVKISAMKKTDTKEFAGNIEKYVETNPNLIHLTERL